jgi:hypothetical protein
MAKKYGLHSRPKYPTTIKHVITNIVSQKSHTMGKTQKLNGKKTVDRG